MEYDKRFEANYRLFERNPPEYDEEVEVHIREFESKIPAHMRNLSVHKYEMNRLRVLGLNPGTQMVRAAPVFELVSICIESKDRLVADGKQCKIYGFIVVVDKVENKNAYIVYNRGKCEAEEVWLGDNLSLSGYPFSPAKPSRVIVHLKDAVRNLLLVSGTFDLEYKSEGDYDVCRALTVDGYHGVAKLCYNSFNAAMVGRVRVELVVRNDDEIDFVDVYGSISANLDIHYMKRLGVIESCFLFKKSSKKCVKVRSTNRIALSRSQIVVPACSSVSIKVDLWDNGKKLKIAQGEVEIPTAERVTTRRDIIREDYRVKIMVDWIHPEELFEDEVNKLGSTQTENDKEIMEMMLKHLAPSLSSYDGCEVSNANEASEYMLNDLEPAPRDLTINKPSSSPSLIAGVQLVEIFSVVVDCVQHECAGIHGTVKVHDSLGNFSIFKRENNDIQVLPNSRKILSLQGPRTRSVMYNDFRVSVNLRDDQDRCVSRGYIEWGEEANDYLSWYDRRTCSIIEGDYGFAAVYYSILSSAAQVQLRVVISTTNQDEVMAKVWGNIGAQYQGYEYSTLYDREYYRSMLFKEKADMPVYVNGKCETLLPLSRCVIAAPVDCALIISLDLAVLDPNSVDGGVLQGLLGFEPFRNYSLSIQGNGFVITVHAEWKLPHI